MPYQLESNKWYNMGKIVGLMLKMCEPFFLTMDFLQRVSLPCKKGVPTPVISPRSDPRVSLVKILTSIPITEMSEMMIFWMT